MEKPKCLAFVLTSRIDLVFEQLSLLQMQVLLVYVLMTWITWKDKNLHTCKSVMLFLVEAKVWLMFCRIAVEANLPSIQLSALENMYYSHMIRFGNVEEGSMKLAT